MGFLGELAVAMGCLRLRLTVVIGTVAIRTVAMGFVAMEFVATELRCGDGDFFAVVVRELQ